MINTLTIKDETTAGATSEALVLEFFTQKITVRELITERVKQEVTNYNNNKLNIFRGLVQPSDTERALNGFKLPAKREINWEKQAKIAEDAFMGNGFLLLVNDKQLSELDDLIEIRPDTEVTFLKLIPLVGG